MPSFPKGTRPAGLCSFVPTVRCCWNSLPSPQLPSLLPHSCCLPAGKPPFCLAGRGILGLSSFPTSSYCFVAPECPQQTLFRVVSSHSTGSRRLKAAVHDSTIPAPCLRASPKWGVQLPQVKILGPEQENIPKASRCGDRAVAALPCPESRPALQTAEQHHLSPRTSQHRSHQVLSLPAPITLASRWPRHKAPSPSTAAT